mmetsp:Transcript_55313/g.125734  ORF Transcript_55313/g.125734 Transcript_55313/m.125734 type:complete len:190 (-) Transcript_55313:65-634(-)
MIELGLEVPCDLETAARLQEAANSKAKKKKKKGGKQKQAAQETEQAAPSVVACDCQFLVADDLEELWKAVSAALRSLLGEGGGASEEVEALAAWWLETLPKVEQWRADFTKSMAAINFKVKPPAADKWLSAAQVEAFLNGEPQPSLIEEEEAAEEEDEGEDDEDDEEEEEMDGDESEEESEDESEDEYD